MLKIIKTPIYDTFLDLCASSNNKIRLCAPYVKGDIVSDVISAKKDTTAVELITNINLMSFCRKASDIQAIRDVLDIESKVYTYSGLHAKFYIFDEDTCIITSANLTSSGLKRNFEYGIISNDKEIITDSLQDFRALQAEEKSGKITLPIVNEIEKILADLPPTPKLELPKFSLECSDDIYDKDKSVIINNLKNWKRALFLELDKLPDDIFSSAHFDQLSNNLSVIYPNNNFIREKIRQTLQQLRDLGLINFVSRGVYKKLWI